MDNPVSPISSVIVERFRPVPSPKKSENAILPKGIPAKALPDYELPIMVAQSHISAESVEKVDPIELKIGQLDPAPVWQHFYRMTKIPRPSGKEKQIGAYIKGVAKKHGLTHKEDASGNIIVHVPASKGMAAAPSVILQGHTDMVSAKRDGSTHDFEKDPLQLIIEGNTMRAHNTTLGADNGIGISAMLAIMENASLKHGPLVLLFTVDEEGGMKGATSLTTKFLPESAYLINLDGDHVSKCYIGSAGAQLTSGKMTLNRVPTTIQDPVLVTLNIKGLTGGHSGVDIDKGRANAIKLLARILFDLNERMDLDLVSLSGGSGFTAIPQESKAQVVISRDKLADFEKRLKEAEEQLRFEYKATDPNLSVSAAISEEAVPPVIAQKQKDSVINMLNSFLHGPLAMSHAVPGLTETSTNLGILALNGDVLEVKTSQRSFILSAQQWASDTTKAGLLLAGFTVEATGPVCSAWTPNRDSAVVKAFQEVSGKVLVGPPQIRAVHAGVECSEIGKLYPEMQMISIGVTYSGAHSPDEALEIDSVKQFWDLVRGMIEELAEK